MFSYGSGSCAEFFAPRIGPRAKEIVAAADLQTLIDQREWISVDEYDRLEHTRGALKSESNFSLDFTELGDVYERLYAGRGRLVLRGVSTWRREYELS